MKIKTFTNTTIAQKFLDTNPYIRHIHVTESDDCWTVTYHYEE